MGDRLRDYGFMNPFDANQHLSGTGINDWLVDTATYNSILRQYGIASQVEFAVKDAQGRTVGWSTTPPERPRGKLEEIQVPGGTKLQSPTGTGGRNLIQVMPEYRWKITGDIAGANQAFRDAGMQTTRGNIINGAYIDTDGIVNGRSVNVRNTGFGGGSSQYYLDSPDPLGVIGSTSPQLGQGQSINGTNDFSSPYLGFVGGRTEYDAGIGGAASRSYGTSTEITNANGRTERVNVRSSSPSYYIAPGNSFGTPGMLDQGIAGRINNESAAIVRSIFNEPNFATYRTNPTVIRQFVDTNPAFRDSINTYINDTAAQYRAKDSGGPLSVIARGLGGVAQFASMAAGLHGLTAGLGAITSGAGLSGAFNAGMNAAGSIANIGDVVGGIVGNPAIGNLTNVGVGGITGGYEGGVPGAIIGAGGAAIGAGVDYAGGVGEFVRNPLEALGGAFDVVGGAGTNVTGLLNDMGSAAQVGPGSLAANTPPVTGPIIPTESVVVTGTVPAVTNTGSAIGAGIGNIAGNLIGGSVTSAPGNVSFTGSYIDPATGNVVEEYTVTGNASDTTEIGGGGTASTAIGAGAGAATGLLNPTTGGTTGTAGGTTGTAGGTTGTPATTGGTTAGTGLLDQTITGGTTGGTATGSGAATQEPTPVQVGSQEWLDSVLAAAGLGAAGAAGLAGLGGSSPVNGSAFSGTGTPQDFVTPGGGIGDGAGLGGGSGLGDGTGLGGGLGDGTGLGGGLGDGTGLGTGTGEGTGLGAGIGAGLGLLADAAPIVDQAVQATNNPLDFGLPDLSMFGGSQGGLGEATGSGIYGGKMGGFEGKYPKTPKKKKRGITVQIAGARRNA